MSVDDTSVDEWDFLRATIDFAPGQIILELGSAEAQEDDPNRIQVDETHFILPPRLIYHACDPNAYIDWRRMELKALRPVAKGEVVTYHYGTSEYDYTVGAFQCNCGSDRCVGYFSGFRAMSPEQQTRIAEHVSDYIRGVWQQNAQIS